MAEIDYKCRKYSFNTFFPKQLVETVSKIKS